MAELTRADGRDAIAHQQLVSDSRDQSLPLLSTEETFASKLSREASMLASGLGAGVSANIKNKMESPFLTGLEVVGAGALGTALSAMQEAGGSMGHVARVGGAVLLTFGAFDITRRVIPSAFAIADNWNNPQNFEQNKKIIAANLGTALVDYPLFVGTGLLGARLAKGLHHHNSFSDMEIQPSVVPHLDYSPMNYGAARSPWNVAEKLSPEHYWSDVPYPPLSRVGTTARAEPLSSELPGVTGKVVDFTQYRASIGKPTQFFEPLPAELGPAAKLYTFPQPRAIRSPAYYEHKVVPKQSTLGANLSKGFRELQFSAFPVILPFANLENSIR